MRLGSGDRIQIYESLRGQRGNDKMEIKTPVRIDFDERNYAILDADGHPIECDRLAIILNEHPALVAAHKADAEVKK